MRILIVKLSSLGDIVHALPVVADLHAAFPEAVIDWVAEPAFAPLLRRVQGIAAVIECPLRRWTRRWNAATPREVAAFLRRLRRERYDAVLDLQGLTKSALIARLARGISYGLANRTEGASHEAPARWLVNRAISVEPHSHALDRSRELVARALGSRVDVSREHGPPSFGLSSGLPMRAGSRTVVLVHGSSRADKLWPEAHWTALGRRLVEAGWRVALPQADADEHERARRLSSAIGAGAEVWPAMDLGALIDRMAGAAGVIGVDSGPSHIAVALDLPHVQIYNFPTSWRTGPQPRHGHRHQVSVEAQPTPDAVSVWTAWTTVSATAPGLPTRSASLTPATPATPGTPGTPSR